ncbi:MAG TPA: hypothetical protein VF230_10690, partial [Acidimicrobiales bacterium]
CGRSVFEAAGIGADDVAYVDLYSCFPAAVQIAAAELGIDAWDASRVPTLTGGLTFGGGPGNNSSTHAIAQVVAALRADGGSGAFGLVTALGWYVTKHSMGVYGSTPPPNGFHWASPQAEVDALPRRRVVADHQGPATVEAYTVLHDRDGAPSQGVAALVLADGRRTWANTADADLLTVMVTDDLCDRVAAVAGDTFTLT